MGNSSINYKTTMDLNLSNIFNEFIVILKKEKKILNGLRRIVRKQIIKKRKLANKGVESNVVFACLAKM